MQLTDFMAHAPEGAGGSSIWITDRNGKRRQIFVPNAEMRAVHHDLMRFLRSYGREMPHATGGLPGGSPLRQVLPHVKNRFIYRLDLYRAFPSIQGDWVKGLLAEICLRQQLWIPQDVIAEYVDNYCTNLADSGLAIGPPASPEIFNQVLAGRIDGQLGGIAERYGLTYTRYLDDMVFSSWRTPIGKHKRRIIREAVRSAGFKLNYSKTGGHDLNQRPLVVCGIVLVRRLLHSPYGGFTTLNPPLKWTLVLEDLLRRFDRGEPIEPAVIHGQVGVIKACMQWIPLFGEHWVTSRRLYRILEHYESLRPRLYAAQKAQTARSRSR
jgi:hypothetical protein